jgi:hypothetical protein
LFDFTRVFRLEAPLSLDATRDRRGTPFAAASIAEGTAMSLVRLLGFRTLACGCVVGRYRELATSREISYIEEKGGHCQAHGHRRNHTVSDRNVAPAPTLVTQAAS